MNLHSIAATLGFTAIALGVLAMRAGHAALFGPGWVLTGVGAGTSLLLLAQPVCGATGRGTIGRRQGSMTLEMLMVFPIFCILVSLLVQLALIGVAAIAVRQAAFEAARTAIVELAAAQPNHERIQFAASARLSAVSPGGPPDYGRNVAALERATLTAASPWHDERARQRLGFAAESMQLEYAPRERINAPEDVEVVLTFDVPLVAGPAALILGERKTVAGVNGYFLTIPMTCELRSMGSREGGNIG